MPTTKKQKKGDGFRIAADRAALTAAVDQAARVAAKATTAPILTCALLQLADGRLSVSGTDLTVYVRTEVDVVGEGSGAVAVPARPLADLFGLCPTDSIEMSIVDGRLRVVSGDFAAALVTQPESEFPPPPTHEQEATPAAYPAVAFVLAVARVAAAADRDTNRPDLNGVVFEPGDRLAFAATDGRRLACDAVEGTAPSARTVLSLTSVSEILGSVGKADAEEITVAWAADLVTVHAGSTTLYARPADANFPPYERLFLDSYPVAVSVGRKALLDALARMRLLAQGVKNTPVVLVLGSESMTISSGGPTIGDATESIEATVVGDIGSLGAVAFNVALLSDAAKSGAGDEVEFSIEDNVKPVALTFPGLPSYRHLSMPVKMAETEEPTQGHAPGIEPTPEPEEAVEAVAQ